VTDANASLRVALLTNFIPPYRAPLFRILSRQFAALRIFIATPMEPNRSWAPDTTGLDVVLLRSLSWNRMEKHPHDFSTPSFVHVPIDSFLRLWKMDPDVVISGQLGFASIVSTLYCAIRKRAALVLWLTLSEVSEAGRGGFRRLIRRWLLRRATVVMVNGASGARYARALGAKESAIFPIYQAIDNAAFAAVRERPRGRGRRLLFVGSLEPRKGLAPFLTHLAQWASAHPAESVELRVAGSGDRRTRGDRGIPVNMLVRWLGEVPYAQLPSVYAEASILVFPTLADEWGLVVNEAMAAGVPVLGSVYSQAVEELVEDGVTGWTFHPDRDEECRAVIRRALETDADTLDRMRAACRDRIRDFDFEAMAGRMQEAIAFAASRRRS